MKIEPRGKYPGVKVHLEEDEVKLFLDFVESQGKTPNIKIDASLGMGSFALKLGKKISKLLVEHPNLLKERTQEEIQAELVNEFESAKQKLEAINHGKDWKEIHVK